MGGEVYREYSYYLCNRFCKPKTVLKFKKIIKNSDKNKKITNDIHFKNKFTSPLAGATLENSFLIRLKLKFLPLERWLCSEKSLPQGS